MKEICGCHLKTKLSQSGIKTAMSFLLIVIFSTVLNPYYNKKET